MLGLCTGGFGSSRRPERGSYVLKVEHLTLHPENLLETFDPRKRKGPKVSLWDHDRYGRSQVLIQLSPFENVPSIGASCRRLTGPGFTLDSSSHMQDSHMVLGKKKKSAFGVFKAC